MKIHYKKLIQLTIIAAVLSITDKTSYAQSWSNVGSGFDNNVYGFVTDTANNVLYAVGHFINAGATTVNHVAKWDGTNWTAMGTGTDQDAYCLAIYNGELYMGGKFVFADGNLCNRIARWDGTTWQPVGAGMDNDVYHLYVYNGELYAAGNFTMVDGMPANLIAKWNGSSWSTLGSGLSGQWVHTMQEYNGEIYVAGNFTDAGGVSVNNIAKWDGANWSDVGGGFTGALNDMNDLIVYNNELYATGSFQFAGSVLANSIAKWNGSAWSDLGSGITGYGGVLFISQGVLYMGGNFTDVSGSGGFMIASYNGITWNTLTSGCDQQVDALEVYGGELIVGGAFNNAGGTAFNKIAKWNSGCTVTAIASGQNISCLGACDGSVSVSVTGNAPFVYVWSTGDSTSSVSGLCPAVYGITVIDSTGCVATDSVSIVEFPLPVITSLSGISPLCPSQCSGTAFVTATGRAPFTYSWSTIPVQTSDTATLLCAGMYYITVTDSAGCSVMDSIVMVDPPIAILSFTSTSTLCPGVCSGTATVTTSSFFPPYTYSWSTNPVQTGQTADSLCPGTYSVTVTDSIGCSVDSVVSITDPAPFVLTFSTASPLCPASCNGLAYVASASPYVPFTYLWNSIPQQVTDTATGLCAGVYSVIVTDSMGCFSTDSISISDPVLTLTLTSTNATCDSIGCNGTATALATGPVPFTYVWSTTDSTNTISNLCAGTYTVIATDSNNCVLTDSVTITQPVPPIVSLNYTSPLCYGQCNGIVNAIPSGTPPFSFSWTTGGTDSTITNACFGWNGVTVTDSAGCSVIDSILVLQPDSLILTSGNTLDVTCHGLCDGYLSVNINGGTFPFSYLWSTNSTQPDQLNLCAGTYTVTVTDANGCSTQFVNTVTEPDTLIVTLTSTDATCQGCNDGTISTSVTGGTPPYNYFFTPIGTDTTHVTAGTYYLCVTDVHACLSCDSTVVSEPNGIFQLANNEKRLHVYPNPFNTTAVILIPADIASSDNLKINFYDLSGKEIKNISFSVKKSNPSELTIDRKNASPGMYIFKLTNKDGIIGAGRLIVE